MWRSYRGLIRSLHFPKRLRLHSFVPQQQQINGCIIPRAVHKSSSASVAAATIALFSTATCSIDRRLGEKIDSMEKVAHQEQGSASAPQKLEGYEYYRKTLKGAKLVVAPMVDQSELAWRMLSRRYGATLCYTPMLHAAIFAKDPKYRAENFQTCPEDRPLIAQFCANDAKTLLEAAQHIEGQCDGVDINLGCPQHIAKRGHYGAFLQDDWDLIAEMVSTLHKHLKVPVTVKIRIHKDLDRTIEYVKMIEKAGCQLLTVHGRVREQKGTVTGLADWNYIRHVKESVKIPVFANGNILYREDIDRCMAETGVDGVMSAEGNLYNPALFSGEFPPCWQMASEYLELAEQYSAASSAVRAHLFKIYKPCLALFPDLRTELAKVHSIQQFKTISERLKTRLEEMIANKDPVIEPKADDPNAKNGCYKSISLWRCQPYFRHAEAPKADADAEAKPEKVEKDPAVVEARKKRKEARKQNMQIKKRRMEQTMCKEESCSNIRSANCEHQTCRSCCKELCATSKLNCFAHKVFFDKDCAKFKEMISQRHLVKEAAKAASH
eukprot:Nk52_evm3s32 gene=Nk52_evmTU3s32